MSARISASVLVAFQLALAAVHADPPAFPLKEFASKEGRFSVLLPGIPRQEVLEERTEAGVISLHLFGVRLGENGFIGVTFADLPEGLAGLLAGEKDREQLLDGARNGMVARVRGRLLREKKLTLKGHPGRELRIEVGDGKGIGRARMYLVGRRQYQVLAVLPADQADSEMVDRVLGSFTLAGDPMPAVLTPEQVKGLIAERDRLLGEASRLREQKKLAEAVAAVEKVVALQKRIFGKTHEEVAAALEILIALHEAREDYRASLAMTRELLGLQEALYGVRDWRVAGTRLGLGFLERLAELSPEQCQALLARVDQLEQLNVKVKTLTEQGKLDEALAPARRALELARQVWGERHPFVGTPLNNLGEMYRHGGEYLKAAPLYRAALEVLVPDLEGHPLHATVLSNLGLVYHEMGEMERAEPLYREALAIRKRTLGEQHSSYARSLCALGMLYRDLGRYREAGPLLVEGVRISKEADGAESVAYAQYLNNLAVFHHSTGEYARVGPLLEEARRIQKKAAGEQHPIYALAVCNEGSLYRDMGELARAEPLLKKGVRLTLVVLGTKHPRYAHALTGLALLYREQGKYAEAEPLLKEALALRKEVLGAGHVLTAESLGNLGLVYVDLAEYGKARPLIEEAVSSTRQGGPAAQRPLATHLSSLATLHTSLGDYQEARKLVSESLALRRKVLSAGHPELALSLNNLAKVTEHLGLLREAEPLYAEALAITSRALGEKHPQYATILANLAGLHDSRAEYRRAEELCLRVRALRGEVLGEEHEAYAASLADLADVYVHTSRLAEARALYEQALAIRRKALGEKHPDFAENLNDLAMLHSELGSHAEAERLFGGALDLLRAVKGERHPDVATGWHNLGKVRQTLGRFAEAGELLRRALEIRQERLGDGHESCARSRLSLATLDFARGEYRAAERLLEQVEKETRGASGTLHLTVLESLGTLYRDLADFERATPLLEGALRERETRKDVQPLAYAAALGVVGRLHFLRGDYPRAERLSLAALEVSGRVLGERHPDRIEHLIPLSELYASLSRLDEARRLMLQAREIVESSLPARHPERAVVLHFLAAVYQTRGDLAAAEPLCQEALAIRKETLGEQHPLYAASLNNLAELYRSMGDQPRAEPLLRRALDVLRPRVGAGHPAVLAAMNNLANVYFQTGDLPRARQLFEQAVADSKAVLGKDHPDHAALLGNLAEVLRALGEEEAAGGLYREALRITRARRGEKSLVYALNLHNLALLEMSQGDHARAAADLDEVSRLLREAGLDRHPYQDITLGDRAVASYLLGEEEEGRRLMLECLGRTREKLDLLAVVQSERQQVRMAGAFGSTLDLCLSLRQALALAPEDVYRQVLAWKGIVLVRQRAMREARSLGKAAPELRDLLDRLADTSRELGALALARPDPRAAVAQLNRLEELSNEKERLERLLAGRSEDFRRQRERRDLPPARLRQSLPAGVALVDFLEYLRVTPAREKGKKWQLEPCLAAFVVRADREVALVELGPVTPIEEAAAAWRKALGWGSLDDPGSPGMRLRRQVWQPLEPHLGGVKTVLYAPDGPLTQIPLAALPGREAGKYLLEELAVAVVPVPQMVPELLAEPGARRGPGAALLVGDVNFDQGAPPPGGDVEHWQALGGGAERGDFGRLPGTRQEIVELERTLRAAHPGARVTRLEGGQATEEALRRQVVGQHWVHLATHGFFAPESVRSALAAHTTVGSGLPRPSLFSFDDVGGFHPALLSGVVLAGANRKPAPGQDDGILTALEVAALDLTGVDLAVLSACETGLGRPAGGEGLLGLQRAFQVAGARTVVASLWKVPDRATQVLMQRFYERLCRGKVSRLEALREAQLWMLREASGAPEQVRGFELLDRQPREPGRRLPPFYWAAFVLSGSWR